ncbi:MAG: DUF4340 domain-containing protein [Candidatus Aminicenantes bacterium]|nr:DUF4340 domain-containing protein [Candidatus Aminicenantes bacterium]
MKLKTTLILLAIFVILLTSIILIENRSEKIKEIKEKAEKLTDFQASEVEKISLKNQDQSIITLARDEKGNWQIVEPIKAEADNYEANSLAENFASLRVEHVVEKEASDLKTYEIPKKEVILWIKGKNEPVQILIGMENPLDHTLYAKRADQPAVVLLPSYLKYSLDKKLFDLRNKEIFKFETKDVKTIEVKTQETNWKAVKEGENWKLTSPIEALASKYQVDNLVDNLARLRAKDFVVEEKKPEDLRNYGFDQPEFTVRITMPESKELTFFLNKKDNRLLATTSWSSKIVEVETQIENDLNKKIQDLREKKVALFNSWEANSIRIKRQNDQIYAFKEKVKGKEAETEKWFIEMGEGKKVAADESKVESVLRKIEYLEASEFIDQPAFLKEYGLDPAEIEITVSTSSSDNQTREIHLGVGKEIKEKKLIPVKNRELNYLFLVDPSFLNELPAKVDDWKQVENKK